MPSTTALLKIKKTENKLLTVLKISQDILLISKVLNTQEDIRTTKIKPKERNFWECWNERKIEQIEQMWDKTEILDWKSRDTEQTPLKRNENVFSSHHIYDIQRFNTSKIDFLFLINMDTF